MLYRLPKKLQVVCSNVAFITIYHKKKALFICLLCLSGNTNKASVWSLSVDDKELENEDELLEEDDLIKPDKGTLIRKYHERKLSYLLFIFPIFTY